MILSIKMVFQQKLTHIFVFLFVNIFFGAMGFWAPLLQPLINNNGSFITKLIEVLATGGAYTFSAAYLAASASYLIFEYLDTKEQNYKTAKIITAGIAAILIVFCMLLAGPQLAAEITKTPQKTLQNKELVQCLILGLSVLTGLILAIIQWAGTFSADAAVDGNQATAKEQSKKIFRNRKSH